MQGTEEDERRGHRRLTVAATAALPGLLVALYLGVGWARRWTVDDAFINYRVVKQIQAGNGPVFNAGERVEVATSTLWLGVLTVADLVSPLDLEWSALGCQLVLGAMGLVAGMAGALRLARLRSPGHRATGVILPLGAAASCAVTVAWDFATGGLENGLTMAWLGGTFWAVVALVDHGASEASRRRLLVTAALVGLGVLVRPDFVPFCAGFAVPVVAVAWRRSGWRSVVAATAAAGALPVAFQVFRMGYYGQLVPNTLHAKESSLTWWDQGWTYLLNFAVPYAIVVPVAATAAWLALSWRSTGDTARRRDWRLVVGGLEAAAALHVLGVVRVGGDYMHGRLLLPAWFALLLPIFAIRAGELRAPRHAAAGAVIAAWMAVSVVWLRPPEGSLFNQWVEDHYDADALAAAGIDDPVGIVDVRDGTVPGLVANPVRWQHFVVWEPELRYDATSGWYDPNTYRPDRGAGLPTPPGVEATVVPGYVLGAASYALPLDVWVYDSLGLADPVVARAELDHRGTAGHEKLLSPAWVAAAWVDPGTAVPDPATFIALHEAAWVWTGTAVPLHTDVETFEADRRAAREAMSCDPLRELVHNARAPLTPRRFLGNVIDSVRLHDLRVPVDPHEARDQLCG